MLIQTLCNAHSICYIYNDLCSTLNDAMLHAHLVPCYFEVLVMAELIVIVMFTVPNVAVTYAISYIVKYTTSSTYAPQRPYPGVGH